MSTLRLFNHYVRVRFLLLAIAQFGLLVGCVCAAAMLRFGVGETRALLETTFLLPQALLCAFMFSIAMASMGLYRPQRDPRVAPLLSRVIAGSALAVVSLLVLFFILPVAALGRGFAALALAMGLPMLLTTFLMFHSRVNTGLVAWRVVFLGAGHNAVEMLAYLRRRSDYSAFRLVGCIPVEGEPIEVKPDLVLAWTGTLWELAEAEKIDEIVVVMDDRRQNFPVDQLMKCRVAGVSVSDMVTFYERQTGRIKTELMNPSWIIFSFGFQSNWLQESAKRVLDIVAAAFLLLLSLPVMLAAAAAIKYNEGWSVPLLYRQQRVGLQGRTFWINKFRSMRVDAEAAGPRWATEADARITHVGHYLRKYRVDELPQLWNVLAGEMSLVGPRPERPEFVDMLLDRLPYYQLRECVRPGITGWAQVGYPYGASEDDARGKLALDIYYVKNRSLFLDLLILISTVEVVLFGKGGR